MNRPIFMFRPNLRNPEHRKAWEILQNVPEGQKNAFLVQAVFRTGSKEGLESLLRRGNRGEIKAGPLSGARRGGGGSPGKRGILGCSLGGG